MNTTEVQWLTKQEWDGGGEAPLLMLVLVAGVVAVAMPWMMARIFGPPSSSNSSSLGTGLDRRAPLHVSLVVAHPDDEAMFFWPVLSAMQREGAHLSVLCLSRGNADGLGDVREAEMHRSCARLGIKGEDLSILEVKDLQDGFHTWPEDVVASHVCKFVKAHGTGLILTFDDWGVSGHPNHVSTSRGVRKAQEVMTIRVLLLESVGLLRKYLGPLNLVLTPMLQVNDGTAGDIYTCCNPLSCLRALAVHSSQLVWYRVLFTVFSSYAYVNSFAEQNCTPSRVGTNHHESAKNK